jgi:hypothetical protein
MLGTQTYSTWVDSGIWRVAINVSAWRDIELVWALSSLCATDGLSHENAVSAWGGETKGYVEFNLLMLSVDAQHSLPPIFHHWILNVCVRLMDYHMKMRYQHEVEKQRDIWNGSGGPWNVLMLSVDAQHSLLYFTIGYSRLPQFGHCQVCV